MKKTSAEYAIAVSFGAIALILLAGIGASVYKAAMTTDTVNVKVTGKERIVESNGDQTTSKYLIFTEGEVFENTDTLLKMKFNSSDLYGKIKDGQTCTFTVNGWRVQFLSMYRNILSAECR